MKNNSMITASPIVSHRRSSAVNNNSVNPHTIQPEKRSKSRNTKRLSWTKPANTAITTEAYGKHGSFEDFLNDYGSKLGRFDAWSGVIASGIRGCPNWGERRMPLVSCRPER